MYSTDKKYVVINSRPIVGQFKLDLYDSVFISEYVYYPFYFENKIMAQTKDQEEK